jgi:hypothetical protein
MAVCKEVVPPEVIFGDGVRVACHLYPPGTDGSRLITAAEVVARGDRQVPPTPDAGAPGVDLTGGATDTTTATDAPGAAG